MTWCTLSNLLVIVSVGRVILIQTPVLTFFRVLLLVRLATARSKTKNSHWNSILPFHLLLITFLHGEGLKVYVNRLHRAIYFVAGKRVPNASSIFLLNAGHPCHEKE